MVKKISIFFFIFLALLKIVSANNPEKIESRLLKSFYSKSGSLEDTIYYAEMLKMKWPRYPGTGSSLYLAGWANLFIETLPNSKVSSFSDYGKFLKSLMHSSQFFEDAANLSNSSFWKQSSTRILRIIHYGFLNRNALRAYLKAKEAVKIGLIKNEDKYQAASAIRKFESLKRIYPSWFKEFKISQDLSELKKALSVNTLREDEASELF